jgi:DNA-binding transcriptional regulator PaaX
MKYGVMNCWDVSKIKDMSTAFFSESSYYGEVDDNINEPIQCWDVSNVTSMYGMFAFLASFNQPLNR